MCLVLYFSVYFLLLCFSVILVLLFFLLLHLLNVFSKIAGWLDGCLLTDCAIGISRAGCLADC